MAVHLLAYEVADLCLGKPVLRSISVASATVADALAALKCSDDNSVSMWSCNHSAPVDNFGCESCQCIGKVCMVDVISYLCREENLSCPSSALKSPVSVLISDVPGLVKHVEPHTSLIEAIDFILQGAQNLVVPIKSTITSNSKRKLLLKPPTSPTSHGGREFCWLTQEDVIRFLLCSIGLFSPIPALSIESLGIITSEFTTIWYHSPAADAVDTVSRSFPVAVVDDEGILVGEISPFALACCDETAAAALTTLSAGDLMAYIDYGGPPEDILRVVRARLKERDLEGMLDELLDSSSPPPESPSSSNSSSSDEQSPLSLAGGRSGRYGRSSGYSARLVRRAEAIVCHPGSSLVAVMIQAIAHRVNYIWVIEEEDCTMVGIVTFSSMLEVFREHLQSMDY